MNKEMSTFTLVKETLGYFFPVAWKLNKGYFILSLIHRIFNAMKPFVSILLLPLIIGELLGEKRVNNLVLYTVILVAGEVFIWLMNYILEVPVLMYANLLENYFSKELGRLSMELDFQLTENKEALDKIEKAKQGMSWYSGGVHGLAEQFFAIIMYGVQIAGVTTLILLHAPMLSIIIISLLIFDGWINNRMNKIEIQSYKELSKINRIFSYVLFEMIDFRFGKDVRLFEAADMMQKKADQQVGDLVKEWDKQMNRYLPLRILGVISNVIRDFANYAYLGYQAILGRIGIPVFSQMVASSSALYQALGGLVRSIQELIKRSNYAHEYVEFMKYPPALVKGSRTVPDILHTIEFKEVSFTYPGTQTKVLDGVSLTIPAGEHLSIVGLNGAGKTTFIKLLCRLYDVDEGAILVDGVDIREYSYEEYQKLFSVVFQDFRLLAFSVQENICIGDKEEEDRIREIVRLAGLGDKLEKLPKGIHTVLFKQFEEDGIEFSGGEQQKLAIARALYKNAPVVILDEPTAALDPMAEYEIYKQFNTLVGDKTAFYISHRLSSCRFCDRIAVFSEGKVKELGTHEELFDLEDGIYAKMYRAQARYYED